MHWASKRTGPKAVAGCNWSMEVRVPHLFCSVAERIGRISRHCQKLWQMCSMMPMEKRRPIRSRRPFATPPPTSSRKQLRIAQISATCPENSAHLVHQEHAARAPNFFLEVRELEPIGDNDGC